MPLCSKCGREVVYVPRWNSPYVHDWGSTKDAKLNASFMPGDRMTWFETAPGEFIPANHHDCPGISEEKWQREREEERSKARKARENHERFARNAQKRAKKPKQGDMF